LRGISTKKLIPFLAVVILLAVLVFPHPAKATVAGDIADFLGFNFSSGTLGAIVNGITTLILTFVKTAISFFADLFDKFIRWQTDNAIYGVVVVDQSWTIIRNFVNMFFILILIIMAFGTIFDIPNYGWKSGQPPMIVSFLISALLVNFSLTIGQYIIAVANGLSGVFLKQIVDVSGTFAQGFNIVGTATSGSTDLISGVTKIIITEIFAIIFLSVVMLAFAAAAIFSLVRIFVLWFLLIISPIAWLGYSLPNLRGQTWSEWWKQFFCWCFFLPYYLFFVMFAVIFVKNRGTIPPIPSGGATAGMAGTDFLFYALSLIFLIGGLVIARKMACASGTGIKTVFGKIEGGVRKYAPGASYVRAIGAGAKEGLKAKGEQIQEKGIPGIIGGAQAERLRQAKWTERFGFGAARGEAERVKLAEIEKESTKLKQELQGKPAEEQKDFLHDAQSRRGVAGEAALFEYVKQGYSTLDDYKEAVKKYGGENSALMRQYLENIKQAKLSDLFQSPDQELRIARGQVEDTRDLINLRRELYKDLAKRNQISDVPVYKEAKQLLSSIPAELKSFLDSIKPEYIVGTKEARQDAIRDRTLGDPDLERKLVEFMKDKKEINDVQLRQEALAIVGGKNTIEGRNVINEINKFNPVINIEADLREERGISVDQPLSADNRKRIIGEIADKISEKEFAGLRKMSGKFWEDEKTQQAVRQTFDGDDIAQLLENAPKEMKRALKDLPRATKPSEAGAAPQKEEPRIIIPSGVTTGRTEETQKSREEILRELGKIP